MTLFFKKIATILEMIKFSHTVFALPFAVMSAFLAAGGLPSVQQLFWILMCMVGARSAAMSFNRIVDARYDAQNPRTAQRASNRTMGSVRPCGGPQSSFTKSASEISCWVLIFS